MTYNERENSKKAATGFTNLACSDAIHLQEKLSLLLTQINNSYHLNKIKIKLMKLNKKKIKEMNN